MHVPLQTSSKCGVTVEFDEQLHIDVVILSSVVASSSGIYRTCYDVQCSPSEKELVVLASQGLNLFCLAM